MKVFLLLLSVFLAPTVVAAFDSPDIGALSAGVARFFFFVVPIAFAVGSAIGLGSRYRA